MLRLRNDKVSLNCQLTLGITWEMVEVEGTLKEKKWKNKCAKERWKKPMVRGRVRGLQERQLFLCRLSHDVHLAAYNYK